MGIHTLQRLILLFFAVLLFFGTANAQYKNRDTWSEWHGIMSIFKGSAPLPSTLLELGRDSTNRALILPRIIDTALITTPSKGMLVYVIPLRNPYIYDGTKWKTLGGGVESVTGYNVDNTDPANPVILNTQVDGSTIIGTGTAGDPFIALDGGTPNLGIDSIRRLAGSTQVEARKNNIWRPQFIDSVGSGDTTGVESVTGYNVNNADPENPIILPTQVDGTTIIGTGTVGDPFIAVNTGDSITPFVDSLRRLPGSIIVEARKGNIWRPQFNDSTVSDYYFDVTQLNDSTYTLDRKNGTHDTIVLRTKLNVSGVGAVDSLTINSSSCADTFRYWIGSVGTIIGIVNQCEIPYSGGVVTLIDTTTFNVTAAINYNIGGNLYSSPDSVVTLAPPDIDTLGRFDLIVIDTTGAGSAGRVVVITGVAGEEPATPSINLNSQKLLAIVFVRIDSIALTTGSPPPTPFWAANGLNIYNTNSGNVGVGTNLPIAKFEVSTTGAAGITLINPTVTTNLSRTTSSPVFAFKNQVRDTINNLSIPTGWNIRNVTAAAAATPNYDLQFNNLAGIPVLQLSSNGTVRVSNTFNFTTAGGISRPTGGINILAGGAINIQAQTASTSQVVIQNVSGVLAADVPMLNIAHGSSTSGVGARNIAMSGDRSLPIFSVYTEGIVGISNLTAVNPFIPSRKAALDVSSIGRGVIFPRMTTAQALGMVKRIATVTLVAPGFGGTGMTLQPPGITASTTGLPAAFTPTMSGGVVTAIAINYTGTNYISSGSLVFDTTGRTVGTGWVLPTATYTVTTDTTATAMMYFDLDSMCYRSFNKTTGLYVNMREGTGGGGGGSNFANTDLTATGDRTHDFDGNDLWINNARRQNFWTTDGVNDARIVIDPGLASPSGITRSSINGTSAILVEDTSVTIVATGTPGNSSSIAVYPNKILINEISSDSIRLEILKLPIVATPTYALGMKADSVVRFPVPTAGSGGEANTASNLGGGVANYSTKVGVDLRFNSFNNSQFSLASNVISAIPEPWFTYGLLKARANDSLVNKGIPNTIAYAGADSILTTSSNLSYNGTNISVGANAIPTFLSASATLNFGSIAAGSFEDLTVTVTGAALSDVVTIGIPNAAITADNITFTAWVSGSNVVTVRCGNGNLTGASNPASGSYKIKVLQ